MDDLQGRLTDRLVKPKKIFTVPRIVFAILGMILLGEVIYAIRVLTSPIPAPPPRNISIQKPVGKISLTAPKISFSTKDVVPVSVMVDTGGQTVDGVDLIVHFDPKILEATSGGIIQGRIFDEYPAVSVDSKTGLIAISGIASLESSFKGVGTFAIINLRAKKPGVTSLMIDFEKGSTVDSNVVETGTSKDILEVVDNLELDIK